MPRRNIFACIALALAATCVAEPPTLLPLQLLPGDDAIGPAWGDQSSPDLAAGNGSLLAVWSDARAAEGKWDIWGMRLAADGAPIDPVAFVIDQADGSQVAPLVAWNGAHWLVTWLDEGKLTAVRLATDGSVLGPPIVIATPGHSASMALASDGSSWAIVWAGTSGGNADVRGARIAADGTLLDPGGVVVLSETFFLRTSFALAHASGGYLLAWPESSATTDNDIVGLRLNASLAPLDATPFPIVATPDTDGAPALASNGTSYCLAWKQMDRSGWVNGITAALVSATGVATPALGVPVGDPRSWGESPDVAWDGAQWIVGWTALGASVARMAPDGTVLDPAGITIAPSADFDVRDIALAATPSGGARAIFVDYRSQRENDIAGAGVSSAGAALPEKVVSLSIPSQQHAQLAWNGSGWAVAFESLTSRGVRILVHLLDADYRPLSAEPIEVAAGDVLEPGIAWSGTRYLVTWKNRAARRIEARRLGADLSFEDASPIDVMVGDNPSVAAAGDAFLVIVEHSPSYWQSRAVYGQRIDGASGTRVGGLIPMVAGFAWGSAIGTIGDRWLVAWEAHQAHDDTIYSVALAYVAQDGSVTQFGGFAGGSGWGVSGLSIASHPSVGAIAWSTTRAPSASNGEIFLTRMAADGTFLDGVAGIELTMGAPREQYAPCVAWNGTEFVTVFQDTRNNPDGIFFFPRSDVYGVRVSAAGVLMDPGGGFAIEATPVPETMPAVAGGGGASLVVASRLVGGNAGALRLGLRGLAPAEPTIPPVVGLRVARSGMMTWQPVADGGYDVLRGILSDLWTDRSVVQAACLADDVPTPAYEDPELPGLDEGFYYVVRADPAPGGAGTYDEPADPSQGQLRDPDTGPAACADLR